MFIIASCQPTVEKHVWKRVKVTATAYNSVVWQTSSEPSIAAWGDTLKPGMKCIAVSRDLIKMGLTHNTIVRIDGLEGEFLVLDKMHKRWQRRIDIYMGTDIKKAREWGKKKTGIAFKKIVDTSEVKK